MDALRAHPFDLDAALDHDGDHGGQRAPIAAGKSTLTSRLSPAPQLVLRVADPATAQALGAALGGATRPGRQAGGRDDRGVADHAQDAVERATASTGAPLPAPLRQRFEGSLGADLGGVRVHTGAASATAAAAVGARAYTVGADIHFGAGRYQPDDPFGMHLLAHEVAHTVQQRGAAPTRQHRLEVSAPHDPAEVEADRAADAMVAGASAHVGAVSSAAVARDADDDLKKAAATGARNGAQDDRVKVMNIHTTIADEQEASAAIAAIDAAERLVANHPTEYFHGGNGTGPSVTIDAGGDAHVKSMLSENHDARFVLEQYLATVSESGNAHSQFAASYATTIKDHGEFDALYRAFEAAGGKLEPGAGSAKMAQMGATNPEFVRARTSFERVRNDLETDRHKISEGQIAMNGASESLTSALYAVRAATARAIAKKKQGKLDAVNQEIAGAVDTIMMVGQIAATAYSGLMAIGGGGLDMSKMVEANPAIAAGPPTPAGATPSLAGPNPLAFRADPSTALPEDGLGKPGDVRTYSMPSQTIETARSLGGKAVGALGGPKAMLTRALTMLEQSKIDTLQAQIEAASEDGNLADAVSAASAMKAKRTAYQEKLTVLIDNVENLLNHKQQLDTTHEQMVAAAKKSGAGKDVTGAMRLVASGDKFLAQVDLTISLGMQQQEKGLAARGQRYNLNDGPYGQGQGTIQGPGQLHYWTVAHEDGGWIGTRHNVELKASGKDSLVSNDYANSTQWDVGKGLEELQQRKLDVTTKRNQAQEAIGLGVSAGQSG